MSEILLKTGENVLVDDEDWQKLSQFKWFRHTQGYAMRSIWKRGVPRAKAVCKVYMHREILGLTQNEAVEVDHINRNKLDNRKVNLRIATVSQNRANIPRRSHNRSSRFKGVRLDKRNTLGRYHARGRFNGKDIHLGTFLDETSAAKAYNTWALKTFGEFACINQIP